MVNLFYTYPSALVVNLSTFLLKDEIYEMWSLDSIYCELRWVFRDYIGRVCLVGLKFVTICQKWRFLKLWPMCLDLKNLSSIQFEYLGWVWLLGSHESVECGVVDLSSISFVIEEVKDGFGSCLILSCSSQSKYIDHCVGRKVLGDP